MDRLFACRAAAHRAPCLCNALANRETAPAALGLSAPVSANNADYCTRDSTLRSSQRMPLSMRPEETTRELARPQPNGQRLRDDMPPTFWIARTMVRSHTGAFTFRSKCVPAGRCTGLCLPKGLDDVHGTVSPNRPLQEVFEPRLRNRPHLVFRQPLRPPIPALREPLTIAESIWQPYYQGPHATSAPDNRH